MEEQLAEEWGNLSKIAARVKNKQSHPSKIGFEIGHLFCSQNMKTLNLKIRRLDEHIFLNVDDKVLGK